MKKVLFLVVLMLLGYCVISSISPEKNNVVVLELFTSQGCSSCPSADKVLSEIKENYKNNNVVTLSYHVDYWNYIGWKDPFSKKSYSEKQRNYAKKLGSSVYTPQLVVNGKTHVVGSNKLKVKQLITKYLGKKVSNTITLSQAKRVGDKITANYHVVGDLDNTTIRWVLVLDKRITKVTRGENKSRTLVNSNIVINEKEITATSKGNIIMNIPEIVKVNESLSLIGIIQNNDLDVLGGIMIPID